MESSRARSRSTLRRLCGRRALRGRARLVFGVVIALCVIACGGADDDPLRIDAASSLREVVHELGELHAARTGSPAPRLNLAGSGELARQVLAARKTDVFLSAGALELERLSAAGLVVPGTRQVLCSNSLVIVALEAHPDFTIEQLSAAEHVAVAHTELVPAGRYAATWLRTVGLFDDLDGKLLRGGSVRAALAAVQSGACEFGIVYGSDVAVAPELVVVHRVPPSEAPSIEYVGAVLLGAPDPAEARAFLELCASPEGRAVFERHGLLPAQAD